MSEVAVMLSGGLDSYIAWHYAKAQGFTPIGVWVDLGQPYAYKERTALDGLGVPFETVRLTGWIQQSITTDSWVIPGRNLMLAVIGASFAERIWLCALRDEMHPGQLDKTPEFFQQATSLLSRVFARAPRGQPDQPERPVTTVETPFAQMTKTDVVAWALQYGIPEDRLRQTSTCYDARLRNCGECGTCFKRWVALTNNGVREEYQTPPWQNSYARETTVDIRVALATKDFSHYSQQRCEETLRALATVGIR